MKSPCRWPTECLTPLLALAIALASCMPPPTTAPGNERRPDDGPARATQATRPLNIAFTNEPTALVGKFARRSGFQESNLLCGAHLVRPDYLGNPVPILAAEAPSVDKGTWRVFDDGRMATTYRLRAAATWTGLRSRRMTSCSPGPPS